MNWEYKMHKMIKYRRAESLDEVLGKPPAFLLRSGSFLILLGFMLMISLSWFIKYPDQIKAEILITTENPPVYMVSRVSGRIDSLFVEDGQPVKAGDVLCKFQSTTSLQQFENLQARLQESHYTDSLLLTVPFPELGEFQQSFADYQSSLRAWHAFRKLAYYPRKREALEAEIAAFDPYVRSLENRIALEKKNLELSDLRYRRDSLLFAAEVTAVADLENARQKLLNQRLAVSQRELDLHSAFIELAQKAQLLRDLELREEEQINELDTRLRADWQKLRAEMDLWKQNYLLISPIDGKVGFNTFWKKDQHVNQNQRVLTIIPREAGRIIGRILLPMRRAGKVAEGQEVNIKLDGYPYMEYGILKGSVSRLSAAPENEKYMLEVGLPEGLKTFYNRELPLMQEMKGTAEIITEDLRFLERLIYPIRFALEKNKSRKNGSD